MKSIPQVQKYMTFVPKTIGYDHTVAQASEYMRKLHIRHLPVLKGGKLIGVITDRDINLILSFKDVDASTIRVDDACSLDPYFTTPEAPLDQVAGLMAEKKYGCALVMDGDKLVGIFTEVDALRALSELLSSRLK